MLEIAKRLENGVVSGPEDLMGIGECLNLLDALEGEQRLCGSGGDCAQQLRQLFTRIILEESEDLEADWSTIRRLTQALSRHLNGDGAGQEEESGGERGAKSLSSSVDLSDEEEAQADLETIRMLMEEVTVSNPTRGDTIDVTTTMTLPDTGSPTGVLELADSPTHRFTDSPLPEDNTGDEVHDPELLRDFLEEAGEHLSAIELNILSLEEDPTDKEAINAIFRPFHSIKGVAGFLNLKDIHYLSHEVENLLDEARSNTLDVTDELIDLVLKSVDMLKALLADVELALNEMRPVGSSSRILEMFSRLLKGFRGTVHAKDENKIRRVGEILLDRGAVGNDALDRALSQSQSKGRKIGEELISEGAVEIRDVSSALREQRNAKENAASVRIDTRKLDNLVDMVGELVIAQSMVLQNPEAIEIKDQKYQKDSVLLRRITNELQRIAMSMRMVPIKSTFQKMIRLVRDLSKKSGKEVTLEMAGEETEIDRNMVEEIYEPLVHMIRNAVDHGIESPEERIVAGKKAQGTVLISAEQKGGNIVIDIKDDGKGLDVEKVRKRAIERNLISAEEQLDERDIYELIFRPGFSTKEIITDVSGRGVGMDIVKKSIERLRGKVEVSSAPGEGTHFHFKLPLTMAIIDGMIIHVGTERYIVPTISMRESFRPLKEAYVTVHGKGEMMKVRDRLMPLIRLHQVFGIEPHHREPSEGLLLVVNEDGRSYCLLADEIVGRQEVVIKSLGASLRKVAGVSGGAILGDGRVALIIDIKGIISHHEGNGR